MSGKSLSVTRIFESRKSSINQIEPLINELKNRFRIPEDLYYNILIVATEAVNNAIIHGNKLDPCKTVGFTLEADDTGVSMTVTDDGEGFDPDCVCDPRQPENLLKPSGRGVFFIKQLATYSEYSNGGRTIKMYFKISTE